MGKKVLGILGSPRHSGKLATLLKTILNQAEAKGHQVRQINLYDLNIEFCRGCMVCRSKGYCVLDDELDNLAKEIVSSDIVVLAAPTYWANVPAIVKNLFDRMVGYIMTDVKDGLPKPLLSKRQRYILLTACTSPFPFNIIFKQSTGALRAMNQFFRISGMTKLGTITLSNTLKKFDIPENILSKAEKIGQSLF